MPGFEEHIALLEATIPVIEAAALVAATTALEIPWQESQNIVPVRLGSLRNSGKPPVAGFINETTVLAGISYGGESTPKFVDYAIEVHEGTPPHEIEVHESPSGRFIKGGTGRVRVLHHPGTGPNKFLEGPILESTPDMEEVMGAVFGEVFNG